MNHVVPPLPRTTRVTVQTEPFLQAYSHAIRRSLGIAPSQRPIVAVQPFGTSKAGEATAPLRLLGQANARDIASQAAGLGQARVVPTLKARLAAARRDGLSAAGIILVLEAACPRAQLGIGAAGVGNAGLVGWAGGDLETARFLGRGQGGEAERSKNEGVGQHGVEEEEFQKGNKAGGRLRFF